VAGPPWLADEMVGRLARYLRFLGQDTAYARGVPDSEVAEIARREHRTILTRDRELSRRVPGTVLLRSTAIADQLREVRAVAPGLRWVPSFDRCTGCNGRLVQAPADEVAMGEPRLTPVGAPVFRCQECGHLYWEGSHSRGVRERVDGWLSEAPR
jgi:uncharacterized protein with PIN domain